MGVYYAVAFTPDGTTLTTSSSYGKGEVLDVSQIGERFNATGIGARARRLK